MQGFQVLISFPVDTKQLLQLNNCLNFSSAGQFKVSILCLLTHAHMTSRWWLIQALNKAIQKSSLIKMIDKTLHISWNKEQQIILWV